MHRLPHVRLILVLSTLCLVMCLSFLVFTTTVLAQSHANTQVHQPTIPNRYCSGGCITVNPSTVHHLPGTKCVNLNIDGINWPANDTVNLVMDSTREIGQVTADSTGAFSFSTRVCRVSKGTHTVTATDLSTSHQNSTSFTVV